jgi:hypothetical protein
MGQRLWTTEFSAPIFGGDALMAFHLRLVVLFQTPHRWFPADPSYQTFCIDFGRILEECPGEKEPLLDSDKWIRYIDNISPLFHQAFLVKGYHNCLPSNWPGFESRRMHSFYLADPPSLFPETTSFCCGFGGARIPFGLAYASAVLCPAETTFCGGTRAR